MPVEPIKRIELTDQNGNKLVVEENESFNIELTFKDVQSTPVQLTEADLDAITLTLFEGDALLNNRNNQDVKDANGGTLDVDGSFVQKVDGADNAVLDSSVDAGDLTQHIARFKWTWTDADDDERSGIVEFIYWVRKLETPS